MKKYKEFLESKGIVLKDGTVLSLISKAKAKGLSAADFITEARARLIKDSRTEGLVHPNNPAHDIGRIVGEM